MDIKHRLKGNLILIMCFFSLTIYGQEKDSLLLRSRYIDLEYKVIQPKSIIIPAVFIAYGLTAPYIKPLHNLDVETNYELREDHPGWKSVV